MLNKKRFILVNLVPPQLTKEQAMKNLQELVSLVETYEGATIVKIIQRKTHPDSNSYIGAGKAIEIGEMIEQEKIDIVVINAVVNPSQLFNLVKLYWDKNPNIKVWDRIDLILHIFEKHAHTAEAKLQIELARMHHMGPRIYGMGMVLSRQGGGIGTRGIGETNTELMKRHWRKEIKNVQEKLEKLFQERKRQLERRKEIGLKTVSIIGYTNAGKTSLFNCLTKKEKLAKNILFATLDSNVGRLYMPALRKPILISDTIGFIQNLPVQLIEAFKSTLMESIHADLLLHVIDISDPDMHEKIKVVEKVLKELDIDQKNRLYIFNKTDLNPSYDAPTLTEMYLPYQPLFISVQNAQDIHRLKSTLEEYFMTEEGALPPLEENKEQKQKINFTYFAIMQYLEENKKITFPHNLGLLFLIGNYLSFYLTELIMENLNKEKKFEQAHTFAGSSQKYTLGQLFNLAEHYIEKPEIQSKLEHIIDQRNELTHELLAKTNDMEEIELEANNKISDIYKTFLDISSEIAPA